ncbi:MAG: SDR family NAD(P)-dependent oxidoreductase [Pseudomonadota bacterium]
MKTVLITGATDGIGRAAALELLRAGHRVLVHGRNPEKLDAVRRDFATQADDGSIETFCADMSDLKQVAVLAQEVSEKHSTLDVLINNAGVLKHSSPVTSGGLDVRFVVNTLAPALLADLLQDRLGTRGRVISLSSAAQAPVSLEALAGAQALSDSNAYAQSKLALTMWSTAKAAQNPAGPVFVAVNPGSLLGTNMVKEGYGMQGKDISIGSGILLRAALDDEFAHASGQYFDNDRGKFADPHPDALDPAKSSVVVAKINDLLDEVKSRA